ncbi:MAG TPA: MBL fold metallo-hydrolase [Burkholderiales bacterium]|nr:MBL fold metallo-hydrolase [Burkholderiales bacterium]
MLFRELNQGKCKSYLLACETTRKASLIDPIREKTDRYLAALAYFGCKLELAIDTHTHADHRSGVFELKELTSAKVVMHRRAPAPHVDIHVQDGQTIDCGELRLRVLATPGHTPDSMSLYADGKVFTGDTLLIRGTGRTDFQGGDPGLQYDSITKKLFVLPDDTLVYPAHDYRGNTQSSIGEEKRLNPRIANRSRTEYMELMAKLGLPLPTKIQEVLQPNQTALDDDRIAFPTVAELNQVRQLNPLEVQSLVNSDSPPLVLDVREPNEYSGELGHIRGSKLIPLKDLASRATELEALKNKHVIAICRAGVRSTTAAAILTSLGFEHVSNLRGGMLEWNEHKLPVER